MFHGGLFGTPDIDDEPTLGSSFQIAGQIITDPTGTAEAVDQMVGSPSDDRESQAATDAGSAGSAVEDEDAPNPDREGRYSGGFGDGIVRSIADATGATEFAQSDQAEQLRRDRARAQETGGISGAVQEFDVATRAGLDFLLDNPLASVQDTTRAGIEAVTGVESEDQGAAGAALGSEFSETASDLTEDTPLDNPVTDAVSTGFEWLVADPAKAGFTATTGIDIDQGTSEGTVGAIDAFDVGITVGTLGLGKAGFSAAKAAARSSDEAGGIVSRVLDGSIDELSAISDEASGAVDDVAQAGDNLPVLADEAAQTGDNLPVLYDETLQTGDGISSGAIRGAADLTTETRGVLSRIGVRLGDELSRLTDNASGASDDAASLADEGAQATDEAVQASGESGGLLSRITGSRAATFGVATGGVVAGGALLDALGTFDRVEVTDTRGNEYLLINEKQYRPTSTHPNGGVLWRVDRSGGSSLGYTVMVGVQGRNVYILDQSGKRVRAKVSAEQFNEAIQRARGAS